MKKIIFLFSFGLQTVGHSQGLLTGLKGCYQLDNDGAMDYSQAGVMGTIMGVSATTGHSGLTNTAYQFAGNTSSKIFLNHSSLYSTSQICVSGWYYVSSTITTPQYLIYTNSGCGTNASYALQVGPAPGPGSSISFNITKSGCGSSVVLSSANYSSGGWHHVVFYISNTDMQLWVDNAAMSTTFSGIPFTYATPVKQIILGGTNESTDSPFSGKMDNVRFYDRLLSNGEITDLYTNDPSCSSTGSMPPTPPNSIGNYCANSVNPLTGDYEMPLNSFNFNFTTPSNTSSKILVGNNSCISGTARLIVTDDNIGNGIYGHSSTSGLNSIGVRGYSVARNGNTNAFGVLAECMLPPATNVTNLAAVAGFCGTMNSSAMPLGEQIAIYGNSLFNGHWAGYFDGDVKLNGTVWGSQYMWGSDKRLKSNINELADVTTKIKNMKSYTYLYNSEQFKNKNFPKTEQIGFLAQELKEVFPQLVGEDSQGFLGVNYVGFIPVLLQAHKEQQIKIEQQDETLIKQQEQINELKALVQSLSVTNSNPTSNHKALNTILEDKTAIVLDQNTPNPFAESTSISYNIPTDFNKAEILFTKNDGTIIKTVTIMEKGKGSLHVYANDLSNGVYTYTLVVDGKSIDSKKMIKQ